MDSKSTMLKSWPSEMLDKLDGVQEEDMTLDVFEKAFSSKPAKKTSSGYSRPISNYRNPTRKDPSRKQIKAARKNNRANRKAARKNKR